MDDEHITDPQENPTGSGHLPVSGEVGSGPLSYHDPVTQPTDDDANDTPQPGQALSPERRSDNMADVGNKQQQPGPDPERIGDDPTPGNGGTAGLS